MKPKLNILKDSQRLVFLKCRQYSNRTTVEYDGKKVFVIEHYTDAKERDEVEEQIRKALKSYEDLQAKAKPKIIIHVEGGLVQETIATSKDVVINIADYDSLDDGDLFTHWNCEPDRVVSEEEFKKLADDMDHNFKVGRQ